MALANKTGGSTTNAKTLDLATGPNVSQDASNTRSEPIKSALVEFKKGKVIFKQKPVSYDKLSETLAEIVRFREMLEERSSQQAGAVTEIPEEHQPVIIKLAQESDKTSGVLAKYIHQQLTPPSEEEEGPPSTVVSMAVIESVIRLRMSRINYGLDTPKPMASLNVWRWEVYDRYRDWLPKAAREKADARLAERRQAKVDLTALFDSLTQEEKDAILPPQAGQPPTQLVGPQDSQDNAMKVSTSTDSVEATPIPSPTKSESDSSRQPKAKKPVDPIKLAKEKEREEKKAARVLKDQKEQAAQSKSRSIMANFFVKPKASSSVKPNQSNAVASSSQSDFVKTFKPFVVRKDTKLAPVNRFARSTWKNRGVGNKSVEVIVIDEASSLEDSRGVCSDLSQKEPLKDFLRKLEIKPSRSQESGLKSYSPVSVREVVAQLSEAEVAGDVPTVRRLLSQLKDRQSIPAKVLIFHTDARPGYLGTWTRSSKVIGPRTPLHRDLLEFDYGYDSGEDWEEEDQGDADDIDNGEEEEEEVEDSDSDVDDWLVDDDEPVDMDSLMKQEDPLMMQDLPFKSTKRKADTGEQKPKESKKRKLVVPLIPYAKGPCFETTIGQCPSDVLRPYQIRMFNDTPIASINPFTFVSTWTPTPEDPKHSSVVPVSVPLTDMVNQPVAPTLDSAQGTPAIPRKHPPVAPKNPFPEAHLQFLLDRINSLKAASLTFLVESIYQDLKSDKNVKKNAIEAKVREVGEKCKIARVWVVKPAS